METNTKPDAIEKRRDPALTLKDMLDRARPSIERVIPKHLSADRLMKVALGAARRSNALLDCSPASFVEAVVKAAELGLDPGGALGDAYLVPFKNEVTLIIGYRGLINLARRSGQIHTIEAHAVFEGDKFTCKYGLDTVLEHEPAFKTEDPAKLRFVYAVAHLKDGGRQFEVMTKAQVDAIRARSRASGLGNDEKNAYKRPWHTDYVEMARKTVARRLCKYLPLTLELATALQYEDERIGGDVIDLPAPKAPPLPEKGTSAPEKPQAEAVPPPKSPAVEEPQCVHGAKLTEPCANCRGDAIGREPGEDDEPTEYEMHEDRFKRVASQEQFAAARSLLKEARDTKAITPAEYKRLSDEPYEEAKKRIGGR